MDAQALRSFGLDGEPLSGERLTGFASIPGIVVDVLEPGSHVDFVTLRVRNEGGGRVSIAKTQHAFIEVLRLEPGEAFVLYCTCPMVDRFLVIRRGSGDEIEILYRRL